MTMGRPKAQIPRSKHISLKVTEFEFEKISKIAEKKNITKTEAILQGIDLLIAHKPKKFKNLNKHHSNDLSVVDDDIKEFL